MTPLARSMKYLRDLGRICEKVEHWNAHARRRQDLFGIADIAYLNCVQRHLVLVQVTTASNASAREKKIRSSPLFVPLLQCGIRVEIHAWSKPTKTRRKWALKVREVR